MISTNTGNKQTAKSRPQGISEWITYVKDKPIPVLSKTLAELQIICKRDDAPIHKIVSIVEHDPGLIAELLRQCNHTKGHKLDRDISSVQQSIMLVGIQRLAHIANTLPSLEESLSEQARQQVFRTFCRAYHAGSQATYWARQRRDMMPDEIFAATQLHYLGEMILSIHAPEQLLTAFKLRREQNISSEEAQYIVLGFSIDQLSLAIAQDWKLPNLVKEALQSENASNPRGFSIMMAVQLSRLGTINWYSDKMYSIYKHMSKVLGVEEHDVSRQAHILAVDIAHQNKFKGVLQAAALLVYCPQPPTKNIQKIKQTSAQDYQADICLMPQVNLIQATIKSLRCAANARQDKNKILGICLKGLHDGIGLNRVTYAKVDSELRTLSAATSVGSENDPIFNKFSIRLKEKDLFKMLLTKPQAICINDSTRDDFWPLVPDEFKKIIGTNSFVAMSIFSKNKPIGIIYADRHTSSCQIDNSSYQYFKRLCRSFSDAIQA